MPIYEYRCHNGHNFEVIQSMSDDPVTNCEVCDQPVERVFHPVAVHFKGSGFYTTDYGGRKGGGGSSDSDSSKKESGGTGASEAKKSESKKSKPGGGDSKPKSATAD